MGPFPVPPRELNDWEKQMIDRLLSVCFPGVEELRIQSKYVQVTAIYVEEDPTVILTVNKDLSPYASVESRVPVMGDAIHHEYLGVQVLLHVVDGYLSELELWSYNNKPIVDLPDPSEFEIFIPPAYEG